VGGELTAGPVALVLAAGRGRRFAAAGGGEFKQNRRFRGDMSTVEHVCGLYADAGLSVVCALHPALNDLAGRLAGAGHRIVTVDNADDGMGRSLATAVAAAPSETGWLVALADMPTIRPATIRQVAGKLVEGAALCAPYYRGRRGHPVAFTARFGRALCELGGDEGGRSILQANEHELVRIDVDDPGVVLDINVPGDLLGLTGP